MVTILCCGWCGAVLLISMAIAVAVRPQPGAVKTIPIYTSGPIEILRSR